MQDDLARVRNDLNTIEAAIGLPPRWDPREVRINLLFTGAGLIAAAWVLVPHGAWPLLGLCFFALPLIEWLRTGKSGESRVTCREFRSALRTAWLALPLVALFAWCQWVGLTPLEFLGLATFLIGTLLFSAALGNNQGRSLAGWAAALMVGGLLIPLELAPVIASLAGTLASGGFISAVLSYAAREKSTSHAAA